MQDGLKLDWFPLYVQRLKASSAWKMPDYQFCWYMKLLIESADSPIPGYLPGSLDKLWQIAGAKSQSYFEKWGGCELVSRLFRRTEIEGQTWIYNERMLKVIHEQGKKLTKHRKRCLSSLSLCIQELPDWIPKEEFGQFMEMREKIGKPLTAHAVKIAVKKLERLKGEGHAAKDVLDQSIFHDWQGLFEIHAEVTNGNGNGTRPTLTDADCATCSGTGWEQTSRGVKECACRIEARGKVSQTPATAG